MGTFTPAAPAAPPTPTGRAQGGSSAGGGAAGGAAPRRPPTPPLLAPSPDVRHERAFWQAGWNLVAGVDEVGRGALAGPLVAAAVVLPAATGGRLGALRRILAGVTDSKQVAPERRQALLERIRRVAVGVGIGSVEVDELDTLGLAAANRLAMERAVAALPEAPQALLLDACILDLDLPQIGVVDGDARVLSIAAASIVAKVTRDRIMTDLDGADARYGFARHKGYGSAFHLAMLARHGPCSHHRRSFAPVGALLAGPEP